MSSSSPSIPLSWVVETQAESSSPSIPLSQLRQPVTPDFEVNEFDSEGSDPPTPTPLGRRKNTIPSGPVEGHHPIPPSNLTQPQTTILAIADPEAAQSPLSNHDWSSPIKGRDVCRTTIADHNKAATIAATTHASVVKQIEEMVSERAEAARHAAFDQALGCLSENKLSVSDLLLYISDPQYKQGMICWESLFIKKSVVEQVLNFWVSGSSNSATGSKTVHDWAVKYVSGVVNKEACKITASQTFQTRNTTIDAVLFLKNDLTQIGEYLSRAFATTAQQILQCTATCLLKKDRVIASALAQLLGEFSQANNSFKKINLVYFYASGAQRQAIAVLSHLGITKAYSILTAKGPQASHKSTRATHPPSLATTLQTVARHEAQGPLPTTTTSNLSLHPSAPPTT
ncbi:hypothetical protein JAAARDRAFT_49667 [Jaapia argillacea MUCL 33604]|uniref:Uncharacterized protein n=1 Tax=Jaapia argillacea MUCL 33604 TaxID=933084 RepID=A0A067PG87_9AGAM|nr:hypothetical protein JAAARDRAFT_49667 [Jaapia argillacea MUCL 33604]